MLAIDYASQPPDRNCELAREQTDSILLRSKVLFNDAQWSVLVNACSTYHQMGVKEGLLEATIIYKIHNRQSKAQTPS